MRDSLSVSRLSKLHPMVRAHFAVFIDVCEDELDITLRITQSLRTIQEQNSLYAQGRSKPGAIVTNARGGYSYHNYGLAIDVVPMLSGVPQWNYSYTKLAAIAERMQIEWGGNFKSIKDNPHFQVTFGLTIKELLHRFESKQVDAEGYIILK